jgi:hypothetical protein
MTQRGSPLTPRSNPGRGGTCSSAWAVAGLAPSERVTGRPARFALRNVVLPGVHRRVKLPVFFRSDFLSCRGQPGWSTGGCSGPAMTPSIGGNSPVPLHTLEPAGHDAGLAAAARVAVDANAHVAHVHAFDSDGMGTLAEGPNSGVL